MTEINLELKKIQGMQLTIDKMLERGSLALRFPSKNTSSEELAIPSNKWEAEPLYQEPDCSVGFVHINNIELGPCETHVHPYSREYLIVIKGSILLNIDGRDIRTVREGECCSIDPGTLHHSKPLTDNTKLIYVCVPQDPYMRLPKKEIL